MHGFGLIPVPMEVSSMASSSSRPPMDFSSMASASSGPHGGEYHIFGLIPAPMEVSSIASASSGPHGGQYHIFGFIPAPMEVSSMASASSRRPWRAVAWHRPHPGPHGSQLHGFGHIGFFTADLMEVWNGFFIIIWRSIN